MSNQNETVYYSNGRGISVTKQFLRTRYRDEALVSGQSVKIGRDPLIFAGVVGTGLALFAYQFGDLLFWHEQALLVFIGIVILAGGYSIAALRIGQYMREKTVLWSTIWTVSAVREAINKALQSQNKSASSIIIDDES